MPYYIINKKPVFLSNNRYTSLKESLLKGKTATQKVASFIRNMPEATALDKSMYHFLETEYSKNPEVFHKEWVCFDLFGNDASENVWDLLYDYCYYYGITIVRDLRDFTTKLEESYEGLDYNYPMGKIFVLDCYIKPLNRSRKSIFNKIRPNVSILVNCNNTERLTGELRDFIIFSRDFIVRCNDKGVVVFPPNSIRSSI